MALLGASTGIQFISIIMMALRSKVFHIGTLRRWGTDSARKKVGERSCRYQLQGYSGTMKQLFNNIPTKNEAFRVD